MQPDFEYLCGIFLYYKLLKGFLRLQEMLQERTQPPTDAILNLRPLSSSTVTLQKFKLPRMNTQVLLTKPAMSSLSP